MLYLVLQKDYRCNHTERVRRQWQQSYSYKRSHEASPKATTKQTQVLWIHRLLSAIILTKFHQIRTQCRERHHKAPSPLFRWDAHRSSTLFTHPRPSITDVIMDEAIIPLSCWILDCSVSFCGPIENLHNDEMRIMEYRWKFLPMPLDHSPPTNHYSIGVIFEVVISPK